MNWLPKLAFFVTCLLLALTYGVWAGNFGWFPKPLYTAAWGAFKKAAMEVDESLIGRHWTISLEPARNEAVVTAEASADPSLRLVALIDDSLKWKAKVLAADGRVIHQWVLDWFELRPEQGDIPDSRWPNQLPGSTVHGVAVASNGDLVFNFDYLSTQRISVCGEQIWALPNLGHHSVFIDRDESIWVSGEIFYPRGSDVPYPNHETPLQDFTIDKIDVSGDYLLRKSIFEILENRGLYGLIFVRASGDKDIRAFGDVYHLNDVEIFPADLDSETLEAGDIMVSLRNINTIMIFDGRNYDIKFRYTGEVLRQHDPDFIGGDKIIVFDNQNFSPGMAESARSRIIEIDLLSSEAREVFRGPSTPDFYTNVMGEVSLMPNGNALVASSMEGRVLEITPEGEIASVFENVLDEGYRGLIPNAIGLPPEMDQAFFEDLTSACQ